MARRAQHGNVRELASFGDLTEEKPASAHVSASDEFRGEEQSLAEHARERVGVFAGRNAP